LSWIGTFDVRIAFQNKKKIQNEIKIR